MGTVTGFAITSWLRAAVLAATLAVVAWPLSVASGVVAALVGAALASLAADRLAQRRLRTGGALLTCAAALLLGLGLTGAALAGHALQ